MYYDKYEQMRQLEASKPVNKIEQETVRTETRQPRIEREGIQRRNINL